MQNRNLKKILKNKFKDAERIAILGIGSELRGDDAAGILIAKGIKAIPHKSSKLKIFLGATAPENLTGDIKKYNPTHLIIIDSAEIGKKPGNIEILEPGKIKGITFSTHKLPVKILADYLTKSINCEIIIIGIQPKTLEFGLKPSKEITKIVNEISLILKKTLID